MLGRPISGRSSGADPTATPEARDQAGAGATVAGNRKVVPFAAQPARETDVNSPMRPRTIQVIAALVAMAAQVAVPAVTAEAIDNAVVAQNDSLTPYVWGLVALGVARGLMALYHRYGLFRPPSDSRSRPRQPLSRPVKRRVLGDIHNRGRRLPGTCAVKQQTDADPYACHSDNANAPGQTWPKP